MAGIGYLGESASMEYTKKEYDMWRNMILRCYDPTNFAYKYYGALGVEVCERWHCFANFIEDLPKLPGYSKYIYAGDKGKFSIDKDYLNNGGGTKIYSPETCILIEQSKNSRMTEHKQGNTSSKYYGVHKLANGNFQCRVMIDTVDYFLGTYDDEIAAANMYNYVVVASNDAGKLNDVPFMTIDECLSHKNSKLPIKIPQYINIPDIDKYNSCASYKGVTHRSSTYTVTYYIDGIKHNAGSFTDPIAAANAYNYYTTQYDINNTHKLNDVPYMEPSEWLKYKFYYRGKGKPEQMYELTNESEEERKARCFARYGVEFL